MNFSSPKISCFNVFTRPFGDVFNLPTSEEVQTGGICWGLPLVSGPLCPFLKHCFKQAPDGTLQQKHRILSTEIKDKDP